MDDLLSHLQLLCHPATPAPMVAGIEVAVDCGSGESDDRHLVLRYRLRADMARLHLPDTQAPHRLDELWRHTCFEAFVGVPGETAYREFNLSPAGNWAAYDFFDYRQRLPDPALPAPLIRGEATAGRLELYCRLPFAALPGEATRPLEFAFCAVVEAKDTVDDAHSYWALRHAQPRPDFHQRAGFTCRWPAA